ncbi:DNA damage-binding protein 1-like [Trifolium pratense]|uniref:DNA damage-binding protein 1-like n=1 Tax=Trifolium pratense TaxID=57577 RepID=A0A2K3P662_TRIPR|nr:DNA damage-binding protein 1-like [Trifolium pratense]
MNNIGKTSIPSTISFLNDETVYIGSSYGDSQLIKLKRQTVEILDSHANLGPILDFCMLGLERQGLGEIVTCSGAYKDGSLRVLCYALGINEKVDIDIDCIKRIWSLKSSIDDPFDTFLVLTNAHATLVLTTTDSKDNFVEAEIAGFCSDKESLFCHDAIYNQVVQVTSESVRLVSSTTKELICECRAPRDSSYTVATGNAAQILLSCMYGLVYMEIEDGKLLIKKETRLDSHVSCLGINSIGRNPNHSNLAAIGFWADQDHYPNVAIYSLPDLDKKQKVQVGSAPEATPRSVLFWAFEEEEESALQPRCWPNLLVCFLPWVVELGLEMIQRNIHTHTASNLIPLTLLKTKKQLHDIPIQKVSGPCPRLAVNLSPFLVR